MRVVVNRQWMLGPRTGIGHYTAELMHGLSELAADEVQPYPSGWIWKGLQGCIKGSDKPNPSHCSSTWFSKLRPLRLVGRALAVPAVRGTLRAWLEPWECRHFQAACRRERYDLYHEPNILPMPCDRPTIASLHDLSAILHPEWHPASRLRKYDRHLERALAQCVHFLTGSDYVRNEIINHLGIAADRVTRVYDGIRAGLAPWPEEKVAAGLKALDLPPTYLLHVGTLEPRKNLDLLVRAYCGLPAAVRSRCPLLLAGKWGWNTKSLAALLGQDTRHRGVIHLGYFPEEQLPLLYNGARALVFPSLYEGFGLPAVEMLACGGAVLASTGGSLPEVVGRYGHLVDPHDIDGWRAAMERVVVDDDWRQLLRRGGRAWALPFTWQRCAANTLQVYRQVLGANVSKPLAA
jgi:glycosyltransferase involved in cell wall biosynthesis